MNFAGVASDRLGLDLGKLAGPAMEASGKAQDGQVEGGALSPRRPFWGRYGASCERLNCVNRASAASSTKATGSLAYAPRRVDVIDRRRSISVETRALNCSIDAREKGK